MKEFVHLTAIKFVSQHTVYEPMNVWSDLKHLKALSTVGAATPGPKHDLVRKSQVRR